MFAVISRLKEQHQTRGCFAVFDRDRVVLEVKTLELPYLDNKPNISCISDGEYECRKIVHDKFGQCIEVLNVKGRSGILFHAGNFATERAVQERAIKLNLRKVDTLGCILPGLHFADINSDGYLDIVNSRDALDLMWRILPLNFKLIIR